MSPLLRAWPLAWLGAVSALAADPPRPAGDLPPLFAPRAERRVSTLAPPARAAMPSALSPLTRARLQESILRLPVAPAPAAAAVPSAASDAVMMERIEVQASRLPKYAVRRDEPPLWRALQSGVLYEKVYPDGRSVQVFFNVLPFTSGGIQPREATRFGLGVSLKW